MASGDQRHGKEPAAVAEDKFPEGLRVLVVDDNSVYLRVLRALLIMLKYKPTTVTDGRTALNMLREGGGDQFDLVITDVHMPGGLELLEHISLEMDLPVIMLSVNGEKESMKKGIEHGAVDYMVKPVNVKQLKNIWKHVVRKNHVTVNHSSRHSEEQRVAQPASAKGGRGGTKSNISKKKKNGWKKPRVSWNGELHNRFLEVVDRLGVDRAIPKMILRMMNVHNLSRESVASHLQKYRLYLKRATDDSSRRRNCYMDMSYEETLPLFPALCYCGSHNRCEAPPSILGPDGLSIQPRNRATCTAGNGGSSMPRLPDTSRHASGLPVGSLVTDHPLQDTVPHVRSHKAYVSVLREKLLEASVVTAVPRSGSSSLAEMPNGGMPQPAENQFPVQPPELIGQFTGPMYAAPFAVVTAQFPYLAGSSGNSWQNNVAPSGFPSPMAGAPILPSSQVNVPLINQLPSFGASPAANQMAGISIDNTASVGVVSEQMTPLFNMASNAAPVEMTNDNFSPMTVNGGSTSSPLPNLQLGSPVAPPPAQMVNGGEDASGIPPVRDDQQAPDEDNQPTYSINAFLEDLFTSVVNHNSNLEDDAFFGGEN